MLIEDLIKNAEKIQEGSEEKLYNVKLERFKNLGIDGNIKFRKPDAVLLSSYVERDKNINYLISETLVDPDLNDSKLKKAYKALTKEDVVKKMFTQEEIQDLNLILGKIISTTRTLTLVDEIKN